MRTFSYRTCHVCVVKVTRVLSANAAIKAAYYLVPKSLSRIWKKRPFYSVARSLTDFVSDFVSDFVGRMRTCRTNEWLRLWSSVSTRYCQLGTVNKYLVGYPSFTLLYLVNSIHSTRSSREQSSEQPQLLWKVNHSRVPIIFLNTILVPLESRCRHCNMSFANLLCHYKVQ